MQTIVDLCRVEFAHLLHHLLHIDVRVDLLTSFVTLKSVDRAAVHLGRGRLLLGHPLRRFQLQQLFLQLLEDLLETVYVRGGRPLVRRPGYPLFRDVAL
jgi:hypothetical protein